jgi:hypothetical protein
MNCNAYDRLQLEVQRVLEGLSKLAESQLAAFRASDSQAVTRLDKELENMVGHKERMLGAMRQHVKDHRCQPHLSEPGLI